MNDPQIDQIIKLLEQTTSLDVVQEFLKAKKISFSAGSWAVMKTDRIIPALVRNEVSKQDLIDFLASVEECGHQHVFLYKTDIELAQQILDKNKIKKLVSDMGMAEILMAPKVLVEPEFPTITDVRFDNEKLVIKIYEKRIYYDLIKDETKDGKRIVEYLATPKRAVSVIRLHPSGILEIRISSHGGDGKYIKEVMKNMNLVSKFFNIQNFTEISLSKIKNKLANEQKLLTDKIKFSESVIIDDDGFRLTASSGSGNADIADSEGLRAGVNAYMGYDAYCDSTNFWFKATENGPTKDIRIRIAGEVNEFALTSNCNSMDYDYSIEQIIFLNK